MLRIFPQALLTESHRALELPGPPKSLCDRAECRGVFSRNLPASIQNDCQCHERELSQPTTTVTDMVAVAPELSVTVNVTVNEPAAGKVCVTDAPCPVELGSPKFQS